MSELSRHNMIEQQIRTWEVLDNRVLALYAEDTLQRESFIAQEDKKPFAYADMMLPIGEGQVMLEPKLEARMLQALAPDPQEKILHIGCGSGYFAALLSRLAEQVTSMEIRPALARAAEARLGGFPNIRVVCADGAHGLPTDAPYDTLVFTAALPHLPPSLAEQLNEGGKLLAVIGSAPAMTLKLFRKQYGALHVQHDILETHLPLLDNLPPPAFSF